MSLQSVVEGEVAFAAPNSGKPCNTVCHTPPCHFIGRQVEHMVSRLVFPYKSKLTWGHHSGTKLLATFTARHSPLSSRSMEAQVLAMIT